MQIGIDQIAKIFESNDKTLNINPKIFTCSICFGLNSNPKECVNKKCKKLFCETCVKQCIGKVIINGHKTVKCCPFCRTGNDFRLADESLIELMKNIKLFCPNLLCTQLYSIESMGSHVHPSNNAYKCRKCKTNPYSPLLKCGICLNFYCQISINKNTQSNTCNVSRCYNCKMIVCDVCIDSFYFKFSQNEILCGICNIDCRQCNSNEAKLVCAFCQKYLCKECSLICSDCDISICREICYSAELTKIKINKKCQNDETEVLNIPNNKSDSCIHREILSYKNLNTCSKCLSKNKIITSNKCKICDTNICIKNCAQKCKSCKNVTCANCIFFCSICKNYNCTLCISKCDLCSCSFKSCKECDSDVIQQCKCCGIKLCLECLTMCNTCSNIFCPSHSTLCVECQDTTCNEHFHSCSLCNDKDKTRKLCMNCTNKCTFCETVTNSMCQDKLHAGNIVKVLSCGHKVCRKCLKGCGGCGEVVLSCPKCIVNYYFTFCNFCDMYLCNKCSKFCKDCEDVYCNKPHPCLVCGKKFIGCMSCRSKKLENPVTQSKYYFYLIKRRKQFED